MTLEEAARVVLRDCLCVDRQAAVVAYFDKCGLGLAEAFIEASAEVLGDGLLARFAPFSEQVACAKAGKLRDTMYSELDNADRLITLLTDADESIGFRVAVAEHAVAKELRILHMPGVDDDLFLRAVRGVDFRDIESRAACLYSKVCGAKVIEIKTRSATGKDYTLQARADGRPVHTCGGVAKPGEIMNLPTGEVYLAPLEKESQGDLVLNGATEDAVFGERDEVILCFERGRLNLERSVFPDFPTSRSVQQLLSKAAALDADNVILCEIGIGVNPYITDLSGDEIWDEKAAGTAHIALGANGPFGGENNKVSYHRDLVFYPRSILVNGEALDHKFGTPDSNP